MPSSARIVVTASGWVMNGSPLLRICPRWWRLGDLVGPLEHPQVGLGVGLRGRSGTAARAPGCCCGRWAPSRASRARTRRPVGGAGGAAAAPVRGVGAVGGSRVVGRRGAAWLTRVEVDRARRWGRRPRAAPPLRVASSLGEVPVYAAGRSSSASAASGAAPTAASALAPGQEGQLEQDDDADHLGPALADQLGPSPPPCRRWPARRRRPAPGRPGANASAVTSMVAAPYSRAYDAATTSPGQLALLAHRHEADAEAAAPPARRG